MYQSLPRSEGKPTDIIAKSSLQTVTKSLGRKVKLAAASPPETQLWLERSVNQLNASLQKSFTAFLLSKSKAQALHVPQVEAEIFQTVVNELQASLGEGLVAIALPHPDFVEGTSGGVAQSFCESNALFRICYMAPQQSRRLAALRSITLPDGNTLRLCLGETIAAEMLRSSRGLQVEPGAAALRQPMESDATNVCECWLAEPEVAATKADESPARASSERWSCTQFAWEIRTPQSLIAWLVVWLPIAQGHPIAPVARNELIQRYAAACATVLYQLRLLQPECSQCQKLELQNQELVRANQLKNEFLANTSHEIRTPLSSILGFTHFLKEQGYCPTNTRHQEYLNIILSSGQHLLALINDILDLSKIEADQLDLQWETVNVADICKSVFTLVKEKAANKGLELRLDLSPEVTTFVVDPLRLKQMLFNLLSNGLKFTPRGSVGLQVRLAGPFLRFTVWDTGTGIPREKQEQLFRPYSQIINSAVNREEGTGLGLALTQKLAELHYGWVEVQSEVNQGSQFTIVLPLTPQLNAGASSQPLPATTIATNQALPEVEQPRQPSLTPNLYPQERRRATSRQPILASNLANLANLPAMPSQQRDQPAAMLARSLNVLLVEDHPPNARLMIAVLSKAGYEVTWAKAGKDMWKALMQAIPALILMDIHLPDVDGLTLIKQLRNHPVYKTIPVIAQTAMAMTGDRETCLEAGATNYVSKPIDFKQLVQLVGQYTGKQ